MLKDEEPKISYRLCWFSVVVAVVVLLGVYTFMYPGQSTKAQSPTPVEQTTPITHP